MSGEVMRDRAGVRRSFFKYVSQNILGMIGISAYILADTFFISQAEGADGITALNLVLPLYSLIYAVGSMIGVGSATRFRIYRARGEEKADQLFSNAVFFAVLLGVCFLAPGVLLAGRIMRALGADEVIAAVGIPYTRIFMMFAPFFMLNHIFNAFVRNDGAPSLAMTATLTSSLFNIVMDYVLMFPLGLGMAGAALATAFSPVVGIAVCSLHFCSKENTIRLRRIRPSVRLLVQSCQLGVAAFVGEISGGVTTMVFNMLILGLARNVGIAAYGIVANTAIVAVSIFNGVSQGAQPLFSEYYGKGDGGAVKKVLGLAVVTALLIAGLLLLGIWAGAPQVTAVFNSEKNAEMAAYAVTGLRLYFIGFLFAGFNIVGAGYLSATEHAGWAFVTSVLRGFAAIIVCAVVMARLFGMTGVWLAFPAAELITAAVMAAALIKSGRRAAAEKKAGIARMK